ncbi:glycerophosphodiester phosphodiesterase [Zunongwangia sp.]|uniref:glycerophosphodiester phosphodiesterase n=1 Tax=Zunongwangia sp. TaxID=1965325 RepID=UPI003AA8EB1F
MTKPLKIGHRGAKGHIPENTLASIKRALNLKVDMIELDVHLCKTGELIVIHDEELESTTNGTGYVAAKTLKQLKSYKTEGGYEIPTLDEVFLLVENQAILNIELKAVGTAEALMPYLKKYSKSKVLVSSFIFDELMTMRGLSIDVPLAVLTEDDLSMAFLQARHLKAAAVHPYHKLVGPDFIRDAHRNNFKVNVWTVNKKQSIEKMKQLGVDGIISDYPDRIA